MTIRQTLLLFISILALFIGGLAGSKFYFAWQQKQIFEFSKTSSETIDLLLTSAGNWAVERGVTNSGLTSPSTASDAMLGIIAKRRATADEAYKKAIEQIQTFEFKGKEDLVAKVQKAYKKAVTLRAEADANLAKSQILRDGTLLKSWVPTMSNLIILSQDLRFALAKKTASTDAELGRQAQLKHFSWLMSEYAGRERAIIGGTISANLSIDEKKLAKLSRFRGKVETGWNLVRKQSKTSTKEVRDSVAQTESLFFGKYEQLRESVYAAGIDGEPFPINAREWIAQSTAAIDTILATQAASTTETAVYVEELLADSIRTLIIMGTICAMAIGVALLSFYVVIVRVTRPINDMTSAMSELAAGDTEIEIPAIGRKDEIGQMAASVQVFKENAIERIRLEKEEEERAARAEEEQKRLIKEQEQRISDEISGIISACSEGDFTQRLDTQGKEGLMLELSEGLNKIGEITLSGISDIKEVLASLSEGDLTQNMSGTYRAIFEEISQSLNGTIANLYQMVEQIKDSAGSIDSASKEISSGSLDLSHRTEQQASTLEETTAAMQQLTEMVKKNAGNATSARSLSEESANVATQGGEVVKEAVSAMENIQNASQKIADIIGTIDEIAFQTNLLALNAAVEAARAGEAGKGFAVVASEVRSLAGRSAEASKEIKTLIQNSVEQVDTGVDLVNRSGSSLENIIKSVGEATELVSVISKASEEQSSSIQEVNSAVSDMDQTTQQNAALVEENTAAAQSMSDQSASLVKLIDFFKTGEQTASAPAASNTNVAEEEEKPASNVASLSAAGNQSTPKASSDYAEGWEEF